MNIAEIKKRAKQIRIEILKMLAEAKSGHPAGALGLADIFSVLFFKFLKNNRLILSNGHVCPVLYASLALSGKIKMSELKTLRKLGSRLQGHPSRIDLPLVETAAGSLGQGLSIAVGKALALKLNKSKNFVFCITSDGEHDEGSTWEAVMAANKFSARGGSAFGGNNLINIIDRNQIQIGGKTEKIMPLGNLGKKYKEFGWQVYTIDGHNYSQIIKTINKAQKSKKPVCIVANTIPGKGVKFMEGKYIWHGRSLNADELEMALKNLK